MAPKSPRENLTKKTVFVLSGGGARGAYQVGVLKQLAEKGIHPDAMYGTSAGALNSLGMAFMSLKELEGFWIGLKDIKALFNYRFPFGVLWDLLRGQWNGVYKADPLEKFINEKAVGEPKFPVTVTRVNLKTMEISYVETTKKKINLEVFKRAALASACTPVINNIVDGQWADGGLREVTPLKRAIQDKATDIIVVLCDPYREDMRHYPESVCSVKEVALRTLGTILQEIFWEDLQNAKWYNENFKAHNQGLGLKAGEGKRPVNIQIYAPEVALSDPLDFSQAAVLKNIALGEKTKPQEP